jgi:hypothetical protein
MASAAAASAKQQNAMQTRPVVALRFKLRSPDPTARAGLDATAWTCVP